MNAPVTTFYLKHCSQPNDANELLTGLRLMLDPGIKLYLAPKENAIVLRALPDEVAMAAKLIAELDLPRKVYKLTYTVTEMDGSRKISSQRFVEMASGGQRVTLKDGAKIPVVTGKFNESTQAAETQMTYLDIGMNFDSTLQPVEGGVEMSWKVERSSVADEKPAAGAPQDPTIRQVVLAGVSGVKLGKTVMLGSADVPDSTRRMEVEAMVEPAP
jgi:type II secretory pathway component GspD/PulD (secretin)